MVSVYVPITHLEKPRGPVTGVQFTVEHAGKRAEVSMLDIAPSSEQSQLDSFCAELRQLGEALLEAARSPESIYWHRFPPERRSESPSD
jgi:hypothetical protein